MSTPKQVDANRRNAARSTGPRTAAGKSASRLNALKHGVYANSPVIVGENVAEYEAVSRSHFERFLPASPEEHTLVATLVRNAWLLERLSRVETDLWDRRLNLMNEDELHPLGRAAEVLSSTLLQLQRRLDSADRSYRRNLELLLKLQAQRAQPVTQPNGFVPAKSHKPAKPAQPAKPVAPPFRPVPQAPPSIPPAILRTPESHDPART